MKLRIPSSVAAMLLALIAFYPAIAAGPGRANQDIVFGRGLNVLGSPAFWRGERDDFMRAGDFEIIKRAGFDHVRINVSAFDSMNGDNILSAPFLRRLDSAVDASTAAGLLTIIDLHDFRECAKESRSCAARVLAFWKQVAPRYSERDSRVAFEILNEPHGAISPSIWNSILSDALAEVRKTNPDRTVVVGPAESNQPKALASLKLPSDDRSIVVTVHYYSPFSFTHQGANWTSKAYVTGTRWSEQAGLSKVQTDFSIVSRWSIANRRPVLLGEFGVIRSSDQASRVAWARTIASAAERQGFSWSYWNFNGSDYGIFDAQQRTWHSEMREALLSGPGYPRVGTDTRKGH